MKKRMKPSKRRVVSSKSAQRRKPAVSKTARKPKAPPIKPKRQPAPAKARRAPAKPKATRAPVAARRRQAPAATKGPSVATFQRRIQGLEEQIQALQRDRVELARWRQYHSQLQEQMKARDSALAFKEKELLDLRRQVDELRTELKKKSGSH